MEITRVGDIEMVEYNGLVYRRYPKGPRRSDRVYYHRMTTINGKRTRRYLHVDMWEDAQGPVPPGHHVHHKDGYDDLSLENLECKPGRAHLSEHMKTPERQEHSRRVADKIRPLTKAWHQSDAGREWHREHSEQLWEDRDYHELECAWCGEIFHTRDLRPTTRFCSNRCRHVARVASGVDDEERRCLRCGAIFIVNKYSYKKYCSSECRYS